MCTVSRPEMFAFRSQCQRAFWQEGVRKAGGINRDWVYVERRSGWMNQSNKTVEQGSCPVFFLDHIYFYFQFYFVMFRNHNY